MRSSVLWMAIAIGCGDDPPVTEGDPPDDGPTPFANDADADGHEPPFDCDDGDAQVYPGHGEFCNGVDDDCDGAVDDDAVDGNDGFVDADGDKAGDSTKPFVSCTVPGWAPLGGDCDDADPTRSPDFEEVCNAIDDDCTLGVDNGAFIGNLHYETLQAAILAAEAGATLELCPDSTQLEAGIVIDRDVTITSDALGDPGPVVIDGSLVETSIFIVDGGDLTLDGLTVRGGSGLPSFLVDIGNVRAGGAVNAVRGLGGHVTVRNTVFEGNTAHAGGAIAATTLDVADSTFVGNVATDVYDSPGGAVWVGPNGAFTIERTTFDGNTAELGGALHTWSSGVLVDVEGWNNTAEVAGFARVETLSDPVTVDLVGADIHDNDASIGGGIELVGASATADAETVIHDNDASLCGGVRILSSTNVASTSWTGGSIEGNAAVGAGGGFCVDAAAGGTIEVSDVLVRDNSGVDGGGISIYLATLAGAIVAIVDSEVSANTATDYGAGIEVDGDGGALLAPNLVLVNVNVAGNAAGVGGGGLWANRTWVAMTDGAVVDNVAEEGGGAYLFLTSTLEAAGTDFAGNIPEDVFIEGGVAYDATDTGATFSCTGADVTCQ